MWIGRLSERNDPDSVRYTRKRETPASLQHDAKSRQAFQRALHLIHLRVQASSTHSKAEPNTETKRPAKQFDKRLLRLSVH